MEQKKKVNEVDKGAIDAAVQQALDSDMPKPMPRPKASPTKVPRPKARPTINIGSNPKTGATRGIDPRDNYSPEDLKRLLMQSAMERMETEGKSLASLRNRSSFDAQDRMQDKNKPIKPKVVKPAQMDLFKEGAMSDLHARIMSSDDPHDAIYKMLTGDGPEEKYIQDMYNDTSAEYGLHPDDDFEDIIDRMVDEIEGDMAFEGYYVMPDIDKERYTPMDGLEGPFQTRAGKPIYYDPKEGAYYDRDTDMYLTYDEFKALDENVAVRRDGKTLSKAEIAKLQRQGVLMKEDDDEDDDLFKDDEFTAMDQEDDDEVNKHFERMRELGMIVYVGDQKFEYSDYTLEDAMRIVDEYADEMEGEPYEVYNADGKLVASGTMRSGAFHEPGIEEGVLMKEGEEKPYICVHAKKGKHECRAESSYAAAKKAAEHWGLKSTSGIDAHLAVDESMTLKNLTQPKRVIHTNKQNFRKNFAKRYTDMYPATSEGHSPHKKGTKKYKAHMAAMHANSVDLNTMRDALKLDESADANTVVAEYTRATLNHSYKTWKQVNEQITFIRSFVKEDVDVNAVATMLHRMHERENLDHKMLVKENVSKLRQIVKDKSAMSIKFADGSMKVDMTTASIFLQVFDKVKEETQAKIIDKIQTKAGFLSMLDLMYKKIG